MIGILFKHISLIPTSKIETICITLSLILAYESLIKLMSKSNAVGKFIELKNLIFHI